MNGGGNGCVCWRHYGPSAGEWSGCSRRVWREGRAAMSRRGCGNGSSRNRRGWREGVIDVMAVVLVIDGYEGFREAMSYCVPRFGHSVLVAADGEAGLTIAGETTVDLVLLAVGGGDDKGYATCEAFKRDERVRRIPIVLTAATLDRDVLVKARAAGAEEVMRKPIDWSEFLALVARIVAEAPRGARPAG